MSSGTRRAPFSLCGSFNMKKPKGCLSLPSAGRLAHPSTFPNFSKKDIDCMCGLISRIVIFFPL